MTIPASIDDSDWREAFGYAGEPDTNGSANIERTISPEDAEVSLAPFTRADVALITAQSEGENDEQSWLIYGQLTDGRWFHIEAWCDYTGWDCQAGGTTLVSSDRDRLIRFGMTTDARARLGCSLTEDA